MIDRYTIVAVLTVCLSLFAGMFLGQPKEVYSPTTYSSKSVAIPLPQSADLLQACDIHATQCTVKTDTFQGTTAPLQGESRQPNN